PSVKALLERWMNRTRSDVQENDVYCNLCDDRTWLFTVAEFVVVKVVCGLCSTTTTSAVFCSSFGSGAMDCCILRSIAASSVFRSLNLLSFAHVQFTTSLRTGRSF